MRLNIYTSGELQQLQRLNAEGKVVSVRPATNEEVWMFGQMQELEGMLQTADAEVHRLSDEVGALREDVASLTTTIRELQPPPPKTPMAGEHRG